MVSFSTMGKNRGYAALAIALAVALAQLLSVSEGHVALTFPAARRFDLDFLDNLRTKAPCGMPKGKKAGRRTDTICFGRHRFTRKVNNLGAASMGWVTLPT